jgi:hypothetical protein
MSLARAFLYAGAGATIATLWDVPDAPGPIFADVLYRELADGRPLSVAAADARRELRRRGAPPRAWAAYVLTGNPETKVAVTGRVDSRVVAASVAGGLGLVLLLGAAFLQLANVRWRLHRPTAALVGGTLAIVGIALQPWPSRYPAATAGPQAERGDARATLTPTIAGGRITWPPIVGANEHIVELFDAAGLPVGSPSAAVSPLMVPNRTEGGWIRIEARRNGQLLARSTLIRLR